MNVFPLAAPWFFSGLAVGFVLNGLIWITIYMGSGDERCQDG
jgi:hypothetical protein